MTPAKCETTRDMLEELIRQGDRAFNDDSRWRVGISPLLTQIIRFIDRADPLASASLRQPLECVCCVDDGLVQEWVSKARAVAKSKGYLVASLRREIPPLRKEIDVSAAWDQHADNTREAIAALDRRTVESMSLASTIAVTNAQKDKDDQSRSAMPHNDPPTQ